MTTNRLELYVHLVWATWNREPLISLEVERRLHREIRCEAENLGCQVFAVGGVEDHIHLLLSFPPMASLSEVMRQVKGVSSRFANAELGFDGSFKWQGSYSAFTVSRWDVNQTRNYVHNQKQHHSLGTVISQLEPTTQSKTKDNC